MPEPRSACAAGSSLPERLERGEVVFYPSCPFPVVSGDDLQFLLAQQLASRAHKNIGYDPATGKASGFLRTSDDQAERLRCLLADFSRGVTGWLGAVLPRYATAWQLDRVSYRPAEESTRKLRLTARNDLLHVDAFPSRPTNGWRILRFFVNVNPQDPRVWVTADTFAELLPRFGKEIGLPTAHNWLERVQQGLLGVFHPARRRRSVYDSFMLRLHNFLKANTRYQETCRKRLWDFPPGSAWMCLTDTATHAALRGRFALEHSFFLSPTTLALPEEAPAALLRKACGLEVLRRAA